MIAPAALDRPAIEQHVRTPRRDRGLLTLLAAFVAALLLIPDRYTVPLVGGLGLRPQQLVVVVMAVTLAVSFRRGRRLDGKRPALMAGLLVIVGVASVVVNERALDDAAFLAAIRLIVTLTLYLLLAVIVAEIANTPARRRYVLTAVVTLAAVGAIFAIHESVTQQPIRLQPTPPGLVEQRDANQGNDAPTTIIRNNVARPAGLATNPLELSAVMALAAPFAGYLALSARRWRARFWYLGCALLIGLGIVLSISRTGILACGVMLVVAAIANIRRPKVVLVGLVAVAALGVTVAKLVPQSVESLSEQIAKNGNSDPSLATRLQDYQELDDLLGPHPWLGRGPQAITTYVSRDGTQMILDNQYLLTIAETGVIGLVAMVALIVSTASTAARRARDTVAERGLFVAVVCAAIAFAVMAATFDVLRFSQASALFMIAVGLSSTHDGTVRPVLERPNLAPVPS